MGNFDVELFANIKCFRFYIKPSTGQCLYVMYLLNYIQFQTETENERNFINLFPLVASSAVFSDLSIYLSIWGGARGVMVIVAGIGHGDTSSNPGLIAFHIALTPLGWIQLFSLGSSVLVRQLVSEKENSEFKWD